MDLWKSTQVLGTIFGGLLMTVPAIPQAAMAQQSTSEPTQLSQPTSDPNSKLNPCPRIFYEEPHNNRVLVPQGCPPNALTSRMMEQGQLPISATPSAYQRNLGVGGEAPSALNPNPRIFSEAPYNRSQSGYQSNIIPGDNLQSTVPTSPGYDGTNGLQTPAPEQTQASTSRIALVNGRANVRLMNDTNAKITYQVIGDTAARVLEGKSEVTLTDLSTPLTVTFQREDGGLLTVNTQPMEESGSLDVTLKETTDVSQDRRAMRIQPNGSVFLN